MIYRLFLFDNLSIYLLNRVRIDINSVTLKRTKKGNRILTKANKQRCLQTKHLVSK